MEQDASNRGDIVRKSIPNVPDWNAVTNRPRTSAPIVGGALAAITRATGVRGHGEGSTD
jgi:hypothetical protein